MQMLRERLASTEAEATSAQEQSAAHMGRMQEQIEQLSARMEAPLPCPPPER
jgi:hypothetical protein